MSGKNIPLIVFLVMCCFVPIPFFMSDKPEVILARAEAQRLKRLQVEATRVVGRIQYIKDGRTGLCFAYYWGGGYNGGPALTTVPCETIPLELLTVAE